MTFAPVEQLVVWYVPEEGRRMKIGRLARKGREILFEYATEHLAARLELSPFKLPLRPGVFTGDPSIFDGLMGLFEDSLPDGWGRLLLDRHVAAAGIPVAALGPLDRLAWVGARAMGALTYEPEHGVSEPSIVDLHEIAADAEAVLADADDRTHLERLIAIGGSPQGARPKALVQVSDDGKTILYGARDIRDGFTPHLVKFRARHDDAWAGPLELAYAHMAKDAGIDGPEARLLGSNRRHPGYFAARRFDRSGRARVHVHTLSGLLHAPHTYPSVGYRELLLVTRRLTRDESAVREMFRRACFNVLAHNRDDHTRNFAFLMSETGEWRAAPAYDLTFAAGPGGEHSLHVGGEPRAPTSEHLAALARDVGLRHADRVIGEVSAAVSRFARHADAAGVPKRVRDTIASALGVSPSPRRAPPRGRAPRRRGGG